VRALFDVMRSVRSNMMLTGSPCVDDPERNLTLSEKEGRTREATTQHALIGHLQAGRWPEACRR
jgi:hypothetical protein